MRLTAAGCGTVPGSAPAAGDLALINRAMQQVEKNYVVPVRSEKLVDNALKGMLTRLDPHSDYMDEREYQELLATTSGEFGGVGIEISVENGVPQVISAIEGTPAAAAGVEPGDRIVKANGEPIIGLEISEVVRRLRGSPGTPVVLTIARANRQSFDVPITRAVIRVDSVKSALKPGRIGYVRITTFNENTPAALQAALARLRTQAGGRLAGLVLDLRNDAGGLLDSCDRGRRRFSRFRDDRLDPRAPPRREPGVRGNAERRPDPRRADGRADQRRLGLGGGDRGRGAAGQPPRDAPRHPQLRQGIGAEHHPDRGQRRAAADHGAVLHAVGQLDPGARA